MKNPVLPENIVQIINELNKNGFEAFAVGGCVRDIILGKTPDDYDVTTNARPEEIKKVFSHLKTIDTGIKHGTVTVVNGGSFVEVTTYRIDGEYKDNRRPEKVTFSKKLADDLSRRDFTINALAYNDDLGFVDCFGGKKDIENKIIRCVGNSEKRFNEDALRILRAIRFSSVLGFSLETETEKAVHRFSSLLCNISKERILSEFKKLLCGDDSLRVLISFRDVMELILPPLKKLSDEQYRISANMAASVMGDFSLKLSALMYFAPLDEVSPALKDLRCDKETIASVDRILSCREASLVDSEKKALLLLYSYDKNILSYLELKHICAGICNNNPEAVLREIEFIQKALQSKKAYKISHLDINGNDLIENNLAMGSDIGRLLEEILMDVIFERVENNKADILKHLEK